MILPSTDRIQWLLGVILCVAFDTSHRLDIPSLSSFVALHRPLFRGCWQNQAQSNPNKQRMRLVKVRHKNENIDVDIVVVVVDAS